MKENYKYNVKALKVGNSRAVSIPAKWLKEQCKKVGIKVVETLDLFIYDDYLEIRLAKKQQKMEKKDINSEDIAESIAKIFKKLDQLEAGMNARFDKLKEAVIGYIDLGSEMARGSVRATLSAIQMELRELEAWKQQSIQKVVMREKMVEQAKAKVAHIEGRIEERKEMFAEAERKKKAAKKATQKKKQMAQEWESEILLIKNVEERKGRTSGNVFWVVTTDKGEYTLFEPSVFDDVAKNQNNKCELKTFRDESHQNIKAFVKVVEVGAAPANAGGGSGEGNPAAKGFVKAEMLVSYAKDLVVAGKEESMEKATEVVIKSYNKVYGELQIMARIIEVIETFERLGKGTKEDPVRKEYQLWTKKGEMICGLINPIKD